MTDISPSAPYRVLARKYRPRNFDQLIGQDALVRTLRNAISSGRVAHAFILTGVRGVGKTTTARIIARALNYTGPDGTTGPTAGPTDDCPVCQAIAEDRHPDVMEMDAASRTGVDDIREILDGVRYGPTAARYKVYIIDEVHMLSKNAFNALLKTLEEPPPHVKFIFATTEIGKVPVTVLSRCQRFDLKRVDTDTLIRHYQFVCGEEKVEAEEEALAMIARAADGSVRDGLSLLDQAIALGDSGQITAARIQDMLGLADRSRLLDLMDCLLSGRVEETLSLAADLYRVGADPLTVILDLLDFVHVMSKFCVAQSPAETTAPNMSAAARDRTAEMARKVGFSTLGRIWQILLKGAAEVEQAPNAQAAAEMVLLRLCFAADLPDPGSLVKQLKETGAEGSAPSSPSPPRTGMVRNGGGGTAQAAVLSPSPQSASLPVSNANLSTLSEVVWFLERSGSLVLASQIVHYAELVHLEPGRIDFHPVPGAPPRLAPDLSKRLGELTGSRWIVSVTTQPGQPTLAAQQGTLAAAERERILSDPAVKKILDAFPGAEILSTTNKEN